MSWDGLRVLWMVLLGEPGTKCLAAGVERRPRDLRVVEYRGEPRFVLKVLLGGAPEDSTRLSLTGKLHGPDRIQSIGIQSNTARIPVFRLRQLDRAAIAIHLRPFSGVKLAGSQSASRRWPAHRVPVWGIDRSGHMQTPICHKRVRALADGSAWLMAARVTSPETISSSESWPRTRKQITSTSGSDRKSRTRAASVSA